MVRIALLLWALLFIILAFSMMPGYMTLVLVIAAVGGLLDAILTNKKKKKEKPNFKLEEREKHF